MNDKIRNDAAKYFDQIKSLFGTVSPASNEFERQGYIDRLEQAIKETVQKYPNDPALHVLVDIAALDLLEVFINEKGL
ncbi:hypothetical protein MYO4S_00234 [Serratia phage 4S]|nr:hypothetical protein MYO4S_00234 [Serratia phage 4S]